MWPWSAGGEGRGSCEFAGGAGPALSAISSAQPCLGQVLPEGVHLSLSSGLGAACFILNHIHESERDARDCVQVKQAGSWRKKQLTLQKHLKKAMVDAVTPAA